MKFAASEKSISVGIEPSDVDPDAPAATRLPLDEASPETGPAARGSLCARVGMTAPEMRAGPDCIPASSMAPELVAGGEEMPLCVASRRCEGGVIDGELEADRIDAMPSSRFRIDIPGFSDPTTFASVVMPRICATAMPRPARHLFSSYSKRPIVCGRASGFRAIAFMTRSLTSGGRSARTSEGGGGSIVAFFVRISMKLSPEYGAFPVVIS